MIRRNRGFSLVELLVTVAIVAIIAAVAVPSYRQYLRRANRADATTALLRLAAAQERFYLQNNTYASAAQLAAAPPAGLGFTGTERGYYTVTVQANGGGFQNGFVATATAAAGQRQADDDDCQTFTVNDQGLRTAADGGNADSTDACWR